MRNKIIDTKITDGSITEPVTTAEAKTHMKITYTDDDTFIGDLITQVRQWVEMYCSISLVDKQVILTTDWCHEWELPYGPVVSIDEVKFRTGTSTSGAAEYDTLVNDDYTTDGEDFKVFDSSLQGRHKITYTVGYSTVPDGLKEAILHEIAFRYYNRGDEGAESSKELLKPYINYSWE